MRCYAHAFRETEQFYLVVVAVLIQLGEQNQQPSVARLQAAFAENIHQIALHDIAVVVVIDRPQRRHARVVVMPVMTAAAFADALADRRFTVHGFFLRCLLGRLLVGCLVHNCPLLTCTGAAG